MRGDAWVFAIFHFLSVCGIRGSTVTSHCSREGFHYPLSSHCYGAGRVNAVCGLGVSRIMLDCFCTTNVDDAGRANGSGFLISDDGLVVTNNHVLEGLRSIHAERVELHFADGRVYLARMVAADPQADIGLLKIQPRATSPLPSFRFLKPGSAAALEPGDDIHVLGAPLGGKLTVATGIYGTQLRGVSLSQSHWPAP